MLNHICAQQLKLTLGVSIIVALGVISPIASAGEVTISLTGAGKCVAGYAAKGFACPYVSGPAPSCTTGWVGIPQMVIPTNISGGTRTIPAFCVMKYNARYTSGTLYATTDPSDTNYYSNPSFVAAESVCAGSGFGLLKESQWLAIAHNLAQVDQNWSGSAVDSGDIINNPSILTTGETIGEMNGNWQFTRHDMTGGVGGYYGYLYTDQMTAPYAPYTRGMGSYPEGLSDGYSGWNGMVPLRGNDGLFAMSALSYWQNGQYYRFRCSS